MIPRGLLHQALKAGQQPHPLLAALFLLLLAACAPLSPPAPTPPAIPPPLVATPWPAFLTDERAVVAGICFESAYDAAGRAFVLRSEADLTWLFDSSDLSGLCRRPSPRGRFDFGGGRVLAGVWSRGMGCTADHAIERIEVDDAARTLTVVARFVTGGTCPYELVRPFWIGVAGYNEYDIRLMIVP